MRDDATTRGYGDDAYIIGLESVLADVRQRCGGYPDSRVDGDGGIVAVVVRERDEALMDARMWREQQAEIERDLERADGTIAANDAVRALPEAERRAAIVAGAGEIWTDDEHARMRDVAATMPVFVRVCQEKREAIRERDEAQSALVALREAASALLRGPDMTVAAQTWRRLEDALSAAPAALAGQVRARALREAADDIADTEFVPDAVDRLRALADEAERAK